jgi:hypothetical protein
MIRAMTAITAHRAGVTTVAGDLMYLTGFAIVATAVAAFAFGRIEAAERT